MNENEAIGDVLHYFAGINPFEGPLFQVLNIILSIDLSGLFGIGDVVFQGQLT
jgi:hypothetical protein